MHVNADWREPLQGRDLSVCMIGKHDDHGT
jgi:hypothetical protein